MNDERIDETDPDEEYEPTPGEEDRNLEELRWLSWYWGQVDCE